MSTEIQTTSNNLPDVKTPGTEIAKALQSSLVNMVPPEDVHAAVKVAIAEAYTVTGYKRVDEKASEEVKRAEAALFAKMLNDITDYIRQYQSSFRVKEIGIAIYRGALGEYGEFMGLSHTLFVKFLKAYKESEARKNEIDKLKYIADTAQPVSKVDKFEWFKASVVKSVLYSDIFQVEISRHGAGLYDFLNSIGLITYSKEFKEEILKTATVNQIQYLSSQKDKSTDRNKRKEISALIERFKLRVDNNTTAETKNNEIISEAKRITFKKFVEDMSLTGADISAMIESKRETYLNLKS